ncbi:hypothetical protein AA101099_1236 [Neoasaia chiangmaiensis NBRC 101099]|uniref:Uncharacterized protein n=1 Tax=Neoasaia chiangmaiensis TaxID=320497 RepID=A0A1U9KNA0_9PROT|nr:DUF3574 domain-containing protein [Neoasaia chiangmaiensis]AQS87281.1 hypothetical protein A0U93_04255 [Neoasaia chiangmaiensis]GBR38547.1 hypothetical protein AA101099_1236 [Neoasaia chiangmaiensis NBRC 101099]GEN15848.1 hypothetical protein NCH01_22790 [Neoasaia chiangmaiensis]
MKVPTLLLVACLAACAPTSPRPSCAAFHASAAWQIDLFFGLSRPDGTVIDKAAWMSFVRNVIAPAFPDGFTITDTQGQWQDRHTHRIILEPSEVVRIVTAPSPQVMQHVDTIRARYRHDFQQQAVGLVTTPACATFD